MRFTRLSATSTVIMIFPVALGQQQILIAPSEEQTTLREILALEASITDRRLREAALGIDSD